MQRIADSACAKTYDRSMSKLLLLVMAVGCGTNSSPAHDVVACGSGWDAFVGPGLFSASSFADGCERQCENPPAGYGSSQPAGPSCTVIDPSIHNGHGGPTGCEYFTFDDGTKGCCFPTGTTPVVFLECEAP